MALQDKKKWNWDLYGGTANKREDSVTIDMSDTEMQRLSDLLDRAVPLIEQVNSLYNQFKMGTERRPPNERQAHLDQVITAIQSMRKPTESARFRVRQLVSKYLAYKDRWDRILKAVENSTNPQVKRLASRAPRKTSRSGG
jgi:Mg2+ and Co2+ transporter CorA